MSLLYYAPRANALCERFLGSVRCECLDHLFILHEKQLHRVLDAYVQYFNQARLHKGIRQQIPGQKAGSVPADHAGGKVYASRSRVDYTTMIKDVHERFHTHKEVDV